MPYFGFLLNTKTWVSHKALQDSEQTGRIAQARKSRFPSSRYLAATHDAAVHLWSQPERSKDVVTRSLFTLG